MAKPEWGAKRICHNCGARYYDMGKSPVVCPKCNTEFDPEAFLKSRRSRPAVIEELPVAKAKPRPEAEDEEDEIEVAGEEIVEEEVEDLEVEGADETVAPAEFEDEEIVADDVKDDLLEDADELDDGEMDEVIDVEGEDDEEIR